MLGIFILAVLGMAMGAFELYLKHKREMAVLKSSSSDHRIVALEQKIDDLAQLVYQQTIALDGVRPVVSERVHERVGA